MSLLFWQILFGEAGSGRARSLVDCFNHSLGEHIAETEQVIQNDFSDKFSFLFISCI